jgi:hypothetical protein
MSPDWSIGIFSSRETPEVLGNTVNAALDAAIPSTLIDIVINGNPELVRSLSSYLRTRVSLKEAEEIRVWSIDTADKANAYNRYIHAIWPEGRLAFFLDGYTRVFRDSLVLLAESLERMPTYLCVTGRPSHRRPWRASPERETNAGGLQGNLFCLRSSAMSELRRRGIRLPLGVYWVDGWMGAMLGFKLAPDVNRWSRGESVFVHPTASWDAQRRILRDLVRPGDRIRRWRNQVRGRIENRAMRYLLEECRTPLEEVPRSMQEAVVLWASRAPEDFERVVTGGKVWVRRAYRRLMAPRDWREEGLVPRLSTRMRNSLASSPHG